MRCRLGLMSVSILQSLFLSAGPTAVAQCRLDTTTSPIAVAGNPLVRRVLSIDAGIAVADATEFFSYDRHYEEAANILHWNGESWDVVQQLLPDDVSVEEGFGYSGALRGDVAVVGAPDAPCAGGERCGAVYVYRFDGSTWGLEGRLTNPGAGELNWFGSAVAFHGDDIVIRSHGIMWGGIPFSGFWTYRYVDGAWARHGLPIINASNELAGARRIQVEGDTLIAGLPNADCAAGARCGKVLVYVFDGNSWSREAVLLASDANYVDHFGAAFSFDGSRLVVGAADHDCADGSDCGAAYVFRRNDGAWIQEAKLTAFDTEQGDNFGEGVAIQGDQIIVGAPKHDEWPVYNLGAAYSFIYADGQWSQDSEIRGFSAPGGSGARFGSSVKIAGQIAVIGASEAQVGRTYAISGNDCNEDGLIDTCHGNVAPSADAASVPCDCAALSSVTFASSAVATGRFLSIEPGNAGRRTAIRVTSTDLPPPHDTANGRVMWVGEPFEVSEKSDVATSIFPWLPLEGPTFMAARLGCTPVYADRNADEVLHVYGRGIIPGSTYTIEIIDGGCPLTQESSFSAPSEFQTAKFGDVVELCTDSMCSAPEGVTHVIDALAIIKKFTNAPGAISKVRADLEPATPDLVITISDAIVVLRAFSGEPYPFALPNPCEQ